MESYRRVRKSSWGFHINKSICAISRGNRKLSIAAFAGGVVCKHVSGEYFLICVWKLFIIIKGVWKVLDLWQVQVPLNLRKSQVCSFGLEKRVCGWDPGSSHQCNIWCCPPKKSSMYWENELASISQEAVQKCFVCVFLSASPPWWKPQGCNSVSNNHVWAPSTKPQSLGTAVPCSQGLAAVAGSRCAPHRLPWVFKYPKQTWYCPDTVVSLCAVASLKCCALHPWDHFQQENNLMSHWSSSTRGILRKERTGFIFSYLYALIHLP